MFAVNSWRTRVDFRQLSSLCPAISAARFVLGMVLGMMAVTMWQQFALTFGLDPVILLAVGLAISGALWIAQNWHPAAADVPASRTLSYLIWCLCAWTLLHPYWVDTVSRFMTSVPLAWLEAPLMKSLVALLVAGIVWIVPGLLWGAVLFHAACRASNSSTARPLSLLLMGIAVGLLFSSLVLAPRFGIELPAWAATAIAAVIGIWLIRHPELAISPVKAGSMESTDSHWELIPLQVAMACVLGVLMACGQRLANQLMPHAFFIIFTQAAGVIAGISLAVWVFAFRRHVAYWQAWIGLSGAAVSSLALAVQPSLVDVSLWMNAQLTNVSWLMAGRAILLISLTGPFGFLLGSLACSSAHHGKSAALVGVAPFLLGVVFGNFLLGGVIEVFPLVLAGTGALLLLSFVAQMLTSWQGISIKTGVLASCLLAVAASLPCWRNHDDASRTAKLLFSTPAFIAYRSGWEIDHLSALDDLRLIHRQEGPSGPLTLWRGRVAELYLREAGIPRSVVSKNHDVVPQFAPEVLQAVYSLVIADRPGRVLVLGLSAGVPLATCLDFPVREVVCVEGNPSLINLVKGPLTHETGIDYFSDDRLTLRCVSPELALMAREDDPFDVILSTPASSSLAGAAAEFTTEFYQRAARQLTERGLFCQRFECVDYGPEPLRIVLKSLRHAFRKTMAIETAAGEFLLFGANSDDVFIPEDLAARLELPHVLRVLEHCGLDWSMLLNQPAYDHEALGEICDESRRSANTIANGRLSTLAPLEVMRWGNKYLELQAVLTSTRISQAPFWYEANSSQPNMLENEIQLTRRTRLVEWLGDSRVSLELLRRLNEVTTQQKVVHENPDSHWWEYRNTLKRQLQERPRTVVQQVKAIDEKPTLHPEDVRRRDYFIALGNAVNLKKTPTREEIAAVERFLEPHDPLLSYFARQEIADLLSRCGEDVDQELKYRLHVIYFAPTRDVSIRNVAAALETAVQHPEALPDDSVRFDVMNGLIQTLRARWESRQHVSQTSMKKVIEDVDQSLVAVEKAVTSMSEIKDSAGVSQEDWQNRKQVIERLLLRPLRSYRAEVKSRQTRSQMQARAIFEKLDGPTREAKP